MSLRQKALLLTALTLAGLMLILALVSAAIWFDSAAQLEQRDLQQAASRITTALSGELTELDRFAGDWAGWDDTYAFISDHNAAYIDSNLTDETLIRGKISSMLFVDLAGQIVYSKTIDLQTNSLQPTSAQWAEYLPALTQHANNDSTITSIVSLDHRPSLVAARPILTSNYEGPIRGTLIMERQFTDEQLRNLERVIGLTLTLYDPRDTQLPADFRQAHRVLSNAPGPEQAALYSQPLNEELIAAYLLLSDVNGEPALLLRAEVPRTAYQYAQTATRTLTIFLLLIGLACDALILILIDQLILRRLARLQTGVGYITTSGDLSARVPVTARDELSRLARSINGMLTALEQAQQENARLLQETRRQLGEISLLHTAAVATARSDSLEAALQEIAQSAYDAFKAVNTMVILCEPDRTHLKIRASVGIPLEMLVAREFKQGQGIIGAVADCGETILVDDVARDPRYDNADARTRSELCVPLKIGERLIGMINVESDQLGFFTAADQRLLETLAHSLSMIVENLRLLEELRAANEQLTELDRLKNQFVANMSHELRTPLNAILGFGELLNDEVPGPLNDEQRNYVQHIYTSGQHLLALINDILDLSKLQARRVELEQRPAYFAEIAAAAQTFVWPAIQQKHQTLNSEVPPDLPSLDIDPLRVKQVLINLLNNACKFTPPAGHITLQAEVWHDGWLRVGVRDTGPGIPPDKQAEVFKEFVQLNWERPVVERGTGLGLAIARRLIELHGGQIWIDSTGQPGEGAAFYFTLPLADPAAPHAATRLLVVDDEPLIIELLQSILVPPEYEVLGIADPTYALECARRDQPDVILLDLMMPQLDGLQLLAALQQEIRTAAIPVIILTAKALSPNEHADLARQVQAILPKTQLRRETLINTIQQARRTPPMS